MDEQEDLAQEGQEGVVAPVEEQQQEEQRPVTVEDLAGEMGWKPQEHWKGDPEKWKPADEFMRRTVDVNKSLSERMKGLEGQISSMARTSAAIAERAVAQEREKWETARNEAIEMGDREAVNLADAKLAAIPTVQPVDPAVESFTERNAKWFKVDDEATAWAINRAGELGRAGITSPQRQLEIVEREAKGLFPEHFPEAVKAPAAPLTKPGPRSGSPNATKGYSSLPADAQTAALDYERRGVCSKEEYAKIYYEQGGA